MRVDSAGWLLVTRVKLLVNCWLAAGRRLWTAVGRFGNFLRSGRGGDLSDWQIPKFLRAPF